MFKSTQSDRLAAGWRLLFQLLLQFVLLILFLVPLSYFGIFQPNAEEFSTRILFQGKVVETAAVLFSIWAACRLVDHRTLTSLGLSLKTTFFRDITAGFIIGGGAISVIYGLLYAGGWVIFTGFAWHSQPAASLWQETLTRLALFILVGISEEVQFRGYIFRNLEEGLNRRWAIGLSSAIFALFHLANPNGTNLAPMLGLFLGGLFFSYAYLKTGALWLPIGIHIGWNFFIGPVYGFPVSGLNTQSWIIQQVQGPEIITGGAFGPEAGLVILPALLTGAGLIYWFARHNSAR